MYHIIFEIFIDILIVIQPIRTSHITNRELIAIKKEIRTEFAPLPAGPYSQGLQIGKRIYVSGQVGINAKTGETPASSEDQTRQTLKNVRYILEAAGASMNDVVKVTAHLSDMSYFDSFNKAYKEFFTEPYPVRTTVGSNLGGFKVEIDVIAEVE